MDSKVGVSGDADVVMDQNHGSITINHFYGDSKVVPAIKPELRRAIGQLFAACDACNQRKLIEKISLRCFKTTDYKSLELEHVYWLIDVARHIASAIDNAVHDQQSTEAIEEKKFLSETGMRASAPARTALRQLIKENLTVTQVSRAWRDGKLTYEDDNQLTVKISRTQKWFGNTLLWLGIACVLPVFFANPIVDYLYAVPPGTHMKDRITLIVFSLISGSSLVFMSTGFLGPHYAATRVSKFIEKVNKRLEQSKSKED